MKISLPLAVLLCLPVMAMADPKYHRLRKKKKGKAGKKFKLPSTTFGYISTDQASSCYTGEGGVVDILTSGNFAACSRYWYTATGSQSSTCAGTSSYVAESRGNTPANGNPGDNTCLAVGDAPSCFVLEGVNDDEPVLVRTSIAWDWSEYISPSSPNSSTCGTLVPPAGPSTLNTCATILTDSSIPVVAADANTLSPPGADGTTGQCYSVNPLTGIPFAVDPGVSTITSTVTFTIEEEEYVCQVTAGGKVCEMWGYSNGYGNNFDSQYVPFRCDDIEGDAFEGYIAFVFDHYKITPVTDGIGQAPQIVLRKV
ncbi:hypothetical protein QTG54_010091 [Skeletonema marinoi]|uniref:Subtilisin n=1 Tax=Skeletonema marinoi TaxID=267567 RepID=A0AAD8Y5H7_9STRA|nr:hypothetical protein QTG54_010091 [Skeletonema marinoi]